MASALALPGSSLTKPTGFLSAEMEVLMNHHAQQGTQQYGRKVTFIDSDEAWDDFTKRWKQLCGVLVFFRKTCCPACAHIAPKVYQSSVHAHGLDMAFVDVDIECCPETVSTLAVDFAPCFHVYVHGVLKHTFTGVSVNELNGHVKRLYASAEACRHCSAVLREAFDDIEATVVADVEGVIGHSVTQKEPCGKVYAKVPPGLSHEAFDFEVRLPPQVRASALEHRLLAQPRILDPFGEATGAFLADVNDTDLRISEVWPTVQAWLTARSGHPSLWPSSQRELQQRLVEAALARRANRLELWLLLSLAEVPGPRGLQERLGFEVRERLARRLHGIRDFSRPCPATCARCKLQCSAGPENHLGGHDCLSDHQCHRTSPSGPARNAQRQCLRASGHPGLCLFQQLDGVDPHDESYVDVLAPLSVLRTIEPPVIQPAEAPTCSICLDNLFADGACVALPCNHAFHRLCSVEWLVRRPFCPLCRTPALTERPCGEIPWAWAFVEDVARAEDDLPLSEHQNLTSALVPSSESAQGNNDHADITGYDLLDASIIEIDEVDNQNFLAYLNDLPPVSQNENPYLDLGEPDVLMGGCAPSRIPSTTHRIVEHRERGTTHDIVEHRERDSGGGELRDMGKANSISAHLAEPARTPEKLSEENDPQDESKQTLGLAASAVLDLSAAVTTSNITPKPSPSEPMSTSMEQFAEVSYPNVKTAPLEIETQRDSFVDERPFSMDVSGSSVKSEGMRTAPNRSTKITSLRQSGKIKASEIETQRSAPPVDASEQPFLSPQLLELLNSSRPQIIRHRPRSAGKARTSEPSGPQHIKETTEMCSKTPESVSSARNKINMETAGMCRKSPEPLSSARKRLSLESSQKMRSEATEYTASSARQFRNVHGSSPQPPDQSMNKVVREVPDPTGHSVGNMHRRSPEPTASPSRQSRRATPESQRSVRRDMPERSLEPATSPSRQAHRATPEPQRTPQRDMLEPSGPIRRQNATPEPKANGNAWMERRSQKLEGTSPIVPKHQTATPEPRKMSSWQQERRCQTPESTSPVVARRSVTPVQGKILGSVNGTLLPRSPSHHRLTLGRRRRPPP